MVGYLFAERVQHKMSTRKAVIFSVCGWNAKWRWNKTRNEQKMLCFGQTVNNGEVNEKETKYEIL